MGRRAALGLFIVSIIYSIVSMLAVAYNLVYLTRKLQARPTRIKAFFVIQNALALVMVFLRMLYEIIPTNQYIITASFVSVFIVPLYSAVMMLEILKLFVILADYLSESRIVLAQIVASLCHVLLLWGTPGIGIWFDSATEETITAQVHCSN
jgi:CBS domain containing-hemolysin-like protein